MRHIYHMYLPMPFKEMRRGPQVILPKDIGMIIEYCNISKESICVDAGTGSGWLACSLARICKKVTSYEIREDFAKIAKHNSELLNLDNLEIKNMDIKKAKEKDVDVVTLDLPEAEKVVKKAYSMLKIGGRIAGYLPHMEQVKRFIAALEKAGFSDISTYEVIARDILVRKEGMRPSTNGVWHTAYLVFATKG